MERARPEVAVLSTGANDLASELARRHGLPTVRAPGPGLVLVPTDRGIELRRSDAGGPATLRIDFGADERARRIDRRSPLVRAVGVDRGVRTVVDATAGLGRDAFTLAALGASVTLIERDPVLAILLDDALARASEGDVETKAIVARLTLLAGPAEELLERLPDRPEAVYLDPMFPARAKRAMAKRDMQLLRDLLGPCEPDPDLIEVARRAATRRVVVKRHRSARPILPRPAATVRGRRVHFDVYTPSTARRTSSGSTIRPIAE